MVEHKTPKEKKSGRKLNLGQHKKTVIGGGLVAAVAIAGIISGIIILSESEVYRGGGTVRWGFDDYPSTFDPILSWWNWDVVGVTIVEQMAEGLFDYVYLVKVRALLII